MPAYIGITIGGSLESPTPGLAVVVSTTTITGKVRRKDLRDREELRAAGRVSFANYWSLFGSAVVNLTDRNEDPEFGSDGLQPLRTRLGVAYQDDCLDVSLTWRRDYVATGDAQRGNSFQVRFALRNLGFR